MAAIPGTEPTPRLKLPYEQEPAASSTGIMTAPDVRQSERTTKGSPVPKATQTVASVPAASTAKPENPTTTAQIPGQAQANAAGVSTAGEPAPKTATPAVASGAAPAVAAGAPPGVPETTPPPAAAATPLPNAPPVPTPQLPPAPTAPTMKSVVGSTASQQELENAENSWSDALYKAATGQYYADVGAENQAEGALRTLTGRMGAAGTINSSIFGEGKGTIATQRAIALSKALTDYNNAVQAANDNLAKAKAVFTHAQEERKREEAEHAERNPPKTAGPETFGGGPFPGPPVGMTTYLGPPGPGGVVPYETNPPSGNWVRVGPGTIKWSRDPAVRAIQAARGY